MKLFYFSIGIFFLIFFNLILSACTNDNEEDLTPVCDTLQMTYDDIVYIFKENCYICHSQEYYDAYGYFNGNVNTDNYDDLRDAAQDDKLWNAVSHRGSIKMPYNQSKLPDCEINKIKSWIDNGFIR